MTVPPRLRKVILTSHVATSVGWLGAVAAYLALDIAAVTSQDVEFVRAAYLAMERIALFVIVPLAVVSVLIGIVNALSTSWGLFRHYWVLAKFTLTLFAVVILLIETQVIRDMAAIAGSGADPRGLPGSLVHSVGGLALLIVITGFSIYKPKGVTRYGWRQQQRQRLSTREQRPVPAR